MTRISFTDAANLAEAICRVKELFGTNPFTSKEYNTNRPKGMALLSTLENHHIVTIVKTETFEKEVNSEIEVDASLDIELFANYVAPILNISKRFVGDEPVDEVTQQYNRNLMEI